MDSEQQASLVRLDASTFQTQLASLATTIAYKVQREGPSARSLPPAVATDIYVLLKQSLRTYDLFCYLNADELKGEYLWKPVYTVVALPLIRSMIDCLYNITVMLESPREKGLDFRRSGYRHALIALEEDEGKLGHRPEFHRWLAKRREMVEMGMRRDGFRVEDVLAEKRWPTLGTYIRPAPGTAPTDHQKFLKSLTYGYWREYSEYAHGTFQGLMHNAAFFIADDASHELRPDLDVATERMIFLHVTRAAAVLLCIVTELQAYFSFEGARIDERLREIWNALLAAPEVKDLYDSRYERLMRDRRIG
jgi:hypothetical protein